jgi:hypothetical protein
MLTACAAAGTAGVRDAAIIAVLLSTGGRRPVVSTLLIEEYDRAAQTVTVSGRCDPVAVRPAAAAYIDRWLDLVGERRGPMFRPVNQWGQIGRTALTVLSVGATISRRRREAGLPPLAARDWLCTFAEDVPITAGIGMRPDAIPGAGQSPAAAAAGRAVVPAGQDGLPGRTAPGRDRHPARHGRRRGAVAAAR